MKLQLVFGLLSLLTVVAFAGCYTQLGYHASSNFEQEHPYRNVRKGEAAHASETESEEIAQEHTDAEDSDGYYGHRKRSYRTTYTYPYRGDTYGSPYGAYPYYVYPSVGYYPYHPFYGGGYYYGYPAPYHRYYSGYYPYRNGYRRYHHSGSRYVPLSRRTYKKSDLRRENRRSRSSRGVTSPRSRSEQPRQRPKDRNRK